MRTWARWDSKTCGASFSKTRVSVLSRTTVLSKSQMKSVCVRVMVGVAAELRLKWGKVATLPAGRDHRGMNRRRKVMLVETVCDCLYVSCWDSGCILEFAPPQNHRTESTESNFVFLLLMSYMYT